MMQLIERFRMWLARRRVNFLEEVADALPSRAQALATRKRIRYCKAHLSEGTSWRHSKQIMEVRLLADERLQLLTKCVRATWFARKFDPSVQVSAELASTLSRSLGNAPPNFGEIAQGLRDCQKTWRSILCEARRVRNPIFAFQVFFRLSESNKLEMASLIVGVLIAAGAAQMLFFYKAAADQFVFAYWVWDDLVIQAINVVPIAVGVVVMSEVLFRLLRSCFEKLGHLLPVLIVLRHPMFTALVLFVILMISASFLGYYEGVEVWNRFAHNGGKESATMMDQTQLAQIHLVGATSRAAVFLQEITAEPEQNGASTDTNSSIRRDVPRFGKVFRDVVCTKQFLRCSDDKENEDLCQGFRVYVIDRDKIVCHGDNGQCEEIPARRPIVTKQDHDQRDSTQGHRSD